VGWDQKRRNRRAAFNFPTFSVREQSAQSWSFLALPAAPIERALFAHWRVRCEMIAVSRQSKPAILTARQRRRRKSQCQLWATLIKQAAEVSTGDAQKLGRLVSRKLFVKPAKEKSLRLVLAARTAEPTAQELRRGILMGSMSAVSAASTA
jgi:hypothetical protein